MLQLKQIELRRGTKLLFENSTLQAHAGQMLSQPGRAVGAVGVMRRVGPDSREAQKGFPLLYEPFLLPLKCLAQPVSHILPPTTQNSQPTTGWFRRGRRRGAMRY